MQSLRVNGVEEGDGKQELTELDLEGVCRRVSRHVPVIIQICLDFIDLYLTLA